MARHTAKKRQPAHFEVGGYSSVMKRTVWWSVTVTTTGITAKRQMDRREVTIEWERLIAMAMFYGHDYGPKNGEGRR